MTEKEKNAGYEIIQAITVGPRDVVLGEMLTDHPQYVTWMRSVSEDGSKRYDWGNYFSNYRDAIADFGRRVQKYSELLPKRRNDSRKAFFLQDACMKDFTEYLNNIVAIQPSCLSQENRMSDYQLLLATGGEGCKPEAVNGIVTGIRLADGEKMELCRSDLLGIVHPTLIPKWALDAGGRFREHRQAKRNLMRNKPKSPAR